MEMTGQEAPAQGGGKAGPLPFDTSVAHQARIYNPDAIVARLMGAVPSGSYIAISHAGSNLLGPEALGGLTDIADRSIQQKVVYRTREQVARFFQGTDLVEPVLVRVEEWRPEPGTDEKGKSSGWCAVGRKF